MKANRGLTIEGVVELAGVRRSSFYRFGSAEVRSRHGLARRHSTHSAKPDENADGNARQIVESSDSQAPSLIG